MAFVANSNKRIFSMHLQNKMEKKNALLFLSYFKHSRPYSKVSPTPKQRLQVQFTEQGYWYFKSNS